MDRWVGKVALITGASVGIGAQIARTLAKNGMKVVAIARRLDKLNELAESIKHEFKIQIYPMACDLRKEEDILRVFKWVNAELGGVDVLINNAGVAENEPIIEGSTETFRKVMDVNVIAMAICSREFVQSVKKRDTSGHIININSIAGHFAEAIVKPVSLYCASKYAVTGMCHSLRNELKLAKLNIKVTSLSPGAVETDMLTSWLGEEVLKQLPMLQAKDIADAVIYVLSAHNAELCEIMMMPHNAHGVFPMPVGGK